MNNDINIWVVVIILFLHWVGDFVLQTDSMAKNKSKDDIVLFCHSYFYSIIFLFPCVVYWCLFGSPMILILVPITIVCHGVQDYFTSRLNARLWKEGRTHAFFVSMGFDQLLHFAQLLITFQILK